MENNTKDQNRYGFATQWPSPFASGWKASSRSYFDLEEAAQEMAKWAVVNLENGVAVEVKLIDYEVEAKAPELWGYDAPAIKDTLYTPTPPPVSPHVPSDVKITDALDEIPF